MSARAALICAVVLCWPSSASTAPVTVEFTPRSSLPYSEDGFTVTALSTGNGVGICGSVDGYLCGGTNVVPIRYRITGTNSFDLLSFDVENFFRTWIVVSSTGAVANVSAVGQMSFAGLPAWKAISYFEIVHDPGQANGFINVDNIRLEAIPGLPGDYNGNGAVDTADYTKWRDNVGSAITLPNDDTAGVGSDDYTRWKNNFGQSSGGASMSTVVPEPSTLALFAIGCAAIGYRRR